MTAASWMEVGLLVDIPARGARVVRTSEGNIAIFRTADDRIFALEDRCPHRNGPLSQGIVHDHKVTCPLHDWVIDLASGEAQGVDTGCTGVKPVKVEGGRIYLRLASRGARAA